MRRDPNRKALQWIVGGSAGASTLLMAVGLLSPHIAAHTVNAGTLTVDAVQTVSRQAKQGLLPGGRPAVDRDVVTTIEVIGLRESTIVYRDRQGNELFRTEPLANRTIVVKDVALPQVTIRETSETPADMHVIDSAGKRIAPIQHQPMLEIEKLAPPGEPIRIGCEPSVSPATAPAMQNIASRCLASIDIPRRIASK